jgi:hypothetical protein
MSSAHFGVCPRCHKADGYINIGRGQWCYCIKHRTTWSPGSNLCIFWRSQTLNEQRAIYAALDFDNFEEVEPFYPMIEEPIFPITAHRLLGSKEVAPCFCRRIARRMRHFIWSFYNRVVRRRDEAIPF